MSKVGRFDKFSGEELYILSRQAIESSYEIVMKETYTKEEKKMHEALMNELIDERHRRGVNGLNRIG